MEQGVNRESVQKAIELLRDHGERVSRRNVRRLTGGGMSTVHKLMSELEALDSLRELAPKDGISDALQKMILQEIGEQVKHATKKYQEQMGEGEVRERELLEALSDTESVIQNQATELEAVKAQAEEFKKEAATAQAVSEETIYRFEKTVIELHEERKQQNELIEKLKVDLAKAEQRAERSEESASNAESTIARLHDDVQKLQKTNLEIEKRAAASAQKSSDLREALGKAEKRIKFLEIASSGK
ncbi:replication region DNA-binding N-term [Malonomonas rubra DSM 5091]|uniref:Replication region DNA-binding N-term n=2 Tax=Malonomonas rubra TaxID=57040 RepID=A0A1M6N2B6_MALRU|nr:replication region DNA-binding N-term [Malonomonas rubra DSM 5091]